MKMELVPEAEGMGITFGPEQVASRPNLAVKIAMIANAWALLEAGAGSLLGMLLRGDSTATIAMLSKIATATAKAQAIREVGKAILNPEELAELKELMKRFESAAVKRNAVVHGMWGTTPERPDSLIWGPPEAITQTMLGLVDHFIAGTADDYLASQRAKFVVYDEAKFDAVFLEVQSIIKDVSLFTSRQQLAMIVHRTGGPAI